MIFLDTDHAWILARDRREFVDALLERVDTDDDDHLLRLAAACLECEEEEVMWMELPSPNARTPDRGRSSMALATFLAKSQMEFTLECHTCTSKHT